MKQFNICRTYGQTLLKGTRNAVELPYGAFYGTDAKSLYYVLYTVPISRIHGIDTNYLEIYRFENNAWYKTLESSKTVDTLYKIADANNWWNMKLAKCENTQEMRAIYRQNKCLRMHSVVM